MNAADFTIGDPTARAFPTDGRSGGGGIEPSVMTTNDEPDRRLSALIAALSLNRGELDADALERLLGLIESTQPSPAKS